MGFGMTVQFASAVLTRVFGASSFGETPEARAASSDREFVRGQTMLAVATPPAKGRRLSAAEALGIFGFDILREAVEEGRAGIVPDRSEPARTLREQREALGFKVETFAKRVGLKPAEVVRAETPGQVSPIRLLEAMSPSLAIDERYLGFNTQASADPKLGVRFRSLAEANFERLSPTAVSKLAEAAWVIARQASLAVEIGQSPSVVRAKFVADNDYHFPTYVAGYRLAARARELLDIGPEAPIPSLRKLIEDQLQIPLVETELGGKLAGATIANGQHRGIVVNIEGDNSNVWVRRMTLAHELGHLLWDPTQRLQSLMVDRYDEIEGEFRSPRDAVEIRANAFAVAFIAPPSEVDRIVSSTFDIWSAIGEISQRFGISITASRAHVRNVCQVNAPHQGSRTLPWPSDEWKAAEDSTNDFFPTPCTPVARRGRFAWTVLRALSTRAISLDTAATLLKAEPSAIEAQGDAIVQLTAPS